MIETFTSESTRKSDRIEQRDLHKADEEAGSLRCLLETFAVRTAAANIEGQSEKPIPLKDVPGSSLAAEGNQFYFNYRGMHLPTWNSKSPDGTASKPFVGVDGKVRPDGKLTPVTDSQGNVLGADGLPLLDSMGMRRFDEKGNFVHKKFDASEPAQMKQALDDHAKEPLNEATRDAYKKLIESADKLDRVDMARTIEANESYVMSHTTAFLWETGYRQLQQTPGSEQALKAKDAELKQKPVLAEQVRRVREGEALDEELGGLIESSLSSRAAYMSRLLNEDSVKQYMSSRDRTLESDVNVQEARRVVSELSRLSPDLIDQLRPTARLLGVIDTGRKEK